MIRENVLIWALLLSASTLSSCGPGHETSPRPRTVLELDSGWSFREAGGGDWIQAAVPGCVHTDLLAAGLIPDPFYGDNEKGLWWTGEKEWVYSCTFTADESLSAHERIFIEFDGLDTYAEVTLNGEHLLSVDNMFISWRADIKPHLKMGENSLEVRFLPPGPIESAKRDSLGYVLPGGDRVFTRKAAYHYGWDWGPRFITCGIWRPVRITGWSGVTIRDLAAKTVSLSREKAIVNIEVALLGDSGNEAELILLDEKSGERFSKKVSCSARNTAVNFEFSIPDPQIWWPAGLGAQALQQYTAEVYIDSMMIDSAGLCFGLRTIELVTDRDEAGESFYFRVNGVPVFMKGANWIPLDSFLPRSTPADYRRLLTAAKDANMNMLRVWGGGIYENDIFYDLCDSLGIIVWQDFMFACAMYPGDREFLESAGREAVQNIIRLRNHPCIALWCGNNENDEGWRNWGWKKGFYPDQRDEIWNAYKDLFTGVLPAAVETYDAGTPGNNRAYHPSSPKFGRADPRSLTEGDAHYWGVWHDAEPFEILEEKIPRFMSEFGFQSLPSMRTIEMFTGPDERRLDSAAMLSHQKHTRGYDLIREYMERWYRVPERFEDYVYVSQLLQAEGMRIGFEAQRRAMPYCMGTLYWQLGDCWPAVSWSSIDFAGEWKALHYAARRAFEPVLVSIAIEDGSLHLYIVSDRLEELGGWISMKLAGFDGTVLWEKTIVVKAPPNGSVNVFSIPLDELLSGSDRSSVVFSAAFDCPGERPSRALRYFAHPKDLKLPDADVTFEIVPDDLGVTLALTSDVLAKNVFLRLDGIDHSSGNVHFSDNFFDILPGETVSVRIDTDIQASEIKDRVRIKTLRDTY